MMCMPRVQQRIGYEGLYLPNHKTNLVIVLDALSLLFWHLINTTANYLGIYKPSSPTIKELHGVLISREHSLTL